MAKKSSAATSKTEPKPSTSSPTSAQPRAERAVIVAGCRTPFAKAFGDFRHLTALDLAKVATRELLYKVKFDPEQLDDVIMGCVLPSVHCPNLGREVVLALGLPDHIPGMTVARACASSAQALIFAAQGIQCGDYQAVLVGGAESMSNVPVPYSKPAVDTLMSLSKAKSVGAKMKTLATLKPADLLPTAPDISESSTGKTMGQHAELMAQLNGITRQAQDELTLASHQNAAKAWENGTYAAEVCSVFAPSPKGFSKVSQDGYVRGDTTLEQLSGLRPAFDKTYGSLTAGNSSGLTDGASCLLVMSESKARELGLKPLAAVVSWANSALSPKKQLLLGPAYAVPKALQKAGLKLSDMDLVDIHEAFAAQVLSVIQALESDEFAKKELGLEQAVGTVDRSKLNVNGGSIALGHPFGATGARIALTLSNELQRRKARYALMTLCAAGGMGTAVILERIGEEPNE
jgi:acetyl-CoA acyltransferase